MSTDMNNRSVNNHPVNREERFKACYPNWLHRSILENTEDTNDYLIYEHAVNEAWKYGTDLAEIDVQELGKQYELSSTKIHSELRKLVAKGKLIPTDYKRGEPNAEFRVPLITDILNKYRKYGVKFSCHSLV